MRHRSPLVLAAFALAVALPTAERAAAQPMDLLRGARTDLAVSSVYRDRLNQAAALVDGDLETAWNSRTGDLAGAWIEVRLPANASVTSIALTAGFTRVTRERDLFTGNHRVSRVRVLRDGREVGVHDLRTDSRELQTLPVTGPGGVYRIEIVGVVPGTQRSWREVCVSELRIMGTAPGARAGERFPRLAVRELSSPRTEPGTADRDQVRQRLREATRLFSREWGALIDAQGERADACGLSDEDAAETANLLQRRRRFFTELAELVELVDDARSDRLRGSAYLHRTQDDYAFLGAGDHDDVAAALGAVVDWLGEDDARCRFASADATLRLRRAEDEVRGINHACEHMTMDYPDDEEPPRDLVRQCRLVERVLPRVEAIVAVADQTRTAAARVSRYDPPADLSERFSAQWTALEAAYELASRSCGWAGP